MTRVRILHIELEGESHETMALVQAALQGTTAWQPTTLEVLAPPVAALPRATVDQPAAAASAPASPRKVTTPAKPARPAAPAPAPAAKSGRKANDVRIQQLLDQGKTVQEVAAAVGLSAATIYARRKKLQEAEGKGGAAKARGGKAKPEPVKIRCQNCGQNGFDPVRCEHCMEKR